MSEPITEASPAPLIAERDAADAQLKEIMCLDGIEPPSSKDDNAVSLVRDAIEHFQSEACVAQHDAKLADRERDAALAEVDRLKGEVFWLTSELSAERKHANLHHHEACESCAATEAVPITEEQLTEYAKHRAMAGLVVMIHQLRRELKIEQWDRGVSEAEALRQKAIADQYQWTWYAAKHEFGVALGKMRLERDEARLQLEHSEAELAALKENHDG